MPMMCTRLMPATGDDWRLSDQDRFTMGDFIGKLKKQSLYQGVAP